jgi:hypothetical protein
MPDENQPNNFGRSTYAYAESLTTEELLAQCDKKVIVFGIDDQGKATSATRVAAYQLPGRLARVAAELVQLNPNVIFA